MKKIIYIILAFICVACGNKTITDPVLIHDTVVVKDTVIKTEYVEVREIPALTASEVEDSLISWYDYVELECIAEGFDGVISIKLDRVMVYGYREPFEAELETTWKYYDRFGSLKEVNCLLVAIDHIRWDETTGGIYWSAGWTDVYKEIMGPEVDGDFEY